MKASNCVALAALCVGILLPQHAPGATTVASLLAPPAPADAVDSPLLTDVQYASEADYDQYYLPEWTAWIGAIWLTRSNPTSETLISSGGAELFNARQFRFGTGAGPDVNLIHHGDVMDIGFRYFQVNQISAYRSIFPPGNSQLELNDPVDLGSDILSQLYKTGLLSVEINARRNVTSNFTLLAGFRYLALDEDLRTRFDLPFDIFPPIDAHIDTANRLYGGQVGATGLLWAAGPVQIQSALKAGVFGNSARNGARLVVPGDSISFFGTHGSQVAFVGDLNFTGVLQLTDHWSLRGGYQLLWVSGVALSTDQYPFVSHHFIPDAQVVTTGDVFFHGALASVQATW